MLKLGLRDYQRQSIDMLWSWFGAHQGNPCLVLPTGAGKSIVLAVIVQEAIEKWPSTRILMLTHQKELIEQDYAKLKVWWPTAPAAIYSAGIGQKKTAQITYAGIQSIYNHNELLGSIDLVIIDEAHLVSAEDTGRYRSLLDTLRGRQPDMRVVGLTATPYRLGHGLITDPPAIFQAPLIEPVSIKDLVDEGFLTRLRSKCTETTLSVEGVAKRGGDYVESELQKAVDKSETSEKVVDEVIRRAEGRKHWLFFCSGVDHAEHVRDILCDHGILADCVTGKTAKKQREKIIDEFKSGQLQAVTNANVLTTGFDFPGIDLIVMMRPTMSPGLYLQMVGRGLRTEMGKMDCLVLDFAGNVAMHGPVTQVQPPAKRGKGQGVAPCKTCPKCDEIVPLMTKVCPACGYEWPKDALEKEFHLCHEDIMGEEPSELNVESWFWRLTTSHSSGKLMLTVTYYGTNLTPVAITEYLLLWHDGYAKARSVKAMGDICSHCGVDYMKFDAMDTLVDALNRADPPKMVTYKRDGKYKRLVSRIWGKKTEAAVPAAPPLIEGRFDHGEDIPF